MSGESELHARQQPTEEQLRALLARVSALEDVVRALQRVINKDASRLAANGTTKRGSRRG